MIAGVFLCSRFVAEWDYYMQNCNSGNELVLLASIIAIIISENVSAEDLTIISDLFSAIGDNLAIIASKRTEIQKSLLRRLFC